MVWDFTGLERFEKKDKPQTQTAVLDRPVSQDEWDFSGLERFERGASQPAEIPATVPLPQDVVTTTQREAPPEKIKEPPAFLEGTIANIVGSQILKKLGEFDLGQKINRKLKEYARNELKHFKKRSPAGYKQMYGDLSVDEAFEKYWQKRVQPTKAFILNAMKGLTSGAVAEDEITKRLTKEHPLAGTAGDITGTVASYLGVAKLLNSLGLGRVAVKTGKALAPKISFAPRILPKAIMNAGTWGGHKAVEETVKAFKERKINPVEVGKNILKDTAFGAAIGTTAGLSQVPAVVSAYGLGYINAKASGASNPEAHLQAAIWALTEGVGSFGRDKRLREEAISMLTDSMKDYALKTNPKLTEEEALMAAQKTMTEAINKQGGLDKVLSDKKYTVRLFEKLNKALRKGLEKVKPKAEVKVVKPKPELEVKSSVKSEAKKPSVVKAESVKAKKPWERENREFLAERIDDTYNYSTGEKIKKIKKYWKIFDNKDKKWKIVKEIYDNNKLKDTVILNIAGTLQKLKYPVETDFMTAQKKSQSVESYLKELDVKVKAEKSFEDRQKELIQNINDIKKQANDEYIKELKKKKIYRKALKNEAPHGIVDEIKRRLKKKWAPLLKKTEKELDDFVKSKDKFIDSFIKEHISFKGQVEKKPQPAKPSKPVKQVEQVEIESPLSKATAYKTERKTSDIKKEVEQEMKDIYGKEMKFHAGVELPLKIEHFKNISNKIKEGVKKLNEPQKDVVTSTAGSIEKWRSNIKKGELYADWSMKTGYNIEKNAKNLEIIDRYLDNPKKYKEHFDKLPAHSKKLHELLKKDYEEMRALAENLGILDTWQENYTPHIYKDHWTKVRRMLYPQGGRLGTKFRFGKGRIFKTMDEAEEAGLHPITDPVLKNAIYKYQLYRTIANKNLVEMLKKLKREDGLPLLMARPRNKTKLKVWENEYKWINVPSLQKFMYVGEAKNKPMLIRMSTKADPQIADLLNNAFSPWTERSKAEKAFSILTNKVKRIIMFNPAIHGWNIMSDVLDEMNFNPYKTYKLFKRGKQLYEKRDKLVERAVEAGLNLQNSFSIGNEIKKYLLADLSKTEKDSLLSILKPIHDLEKKADKILWENIVRNAQLGLFEALTQRVSKGNPKWEQEKVDKVVAHYINTLVGTLPHTWLSKFGREAGFAMLFARNWTYSNLDMVLKAVTGGKRGLGTKVLSEEEQKQISKDFIKHLLKGMFGLLAFTNLLQLGFLTITNKLKEKGIIKGEKKPIHISFSNEKGHLFDVDTGLKTSKGQEIYLVAPLFRYIRDYIGWATEPRKTLYNKLNPVVKSSAEVLFNYNVWKQKKIVEAETPKFEAFLKLAEHWVKSVTPAHLIMTEPGEVRTKFEWIIPFTGTWIRRGAPGGKFTQMLFEYRGQKKYDIDKTDKKIDELLQKGKFKDAIELMDNTDRYSSKRGQAFRIMKFVAPLNYYWRNISNQDRQEFLKMLKEKGYSKDDLKKALKEELLKLKERISKEDKKGEMK